MYLNKAKMSYNFELREYISNVLIGVGHIKTIWVSKKIV